MMRWSMERRLAFSHVRIHATTLQSCAQARVGAMAVSVDALLMENKIHISQCLNL